MMSNRYIGSVIFLISALAVIAPCATPEDFVHDVRSFYSAYRHYNLINVPERQGRSVISEFGGTVPGFPSGPAVFRWRYADRQSNFSEHALKKTDFSISGRSQIGTVGINLPILKERLILDLESGAIRHNRKSEFVFDNRLKLAPFDFATFNIYMRRNTGSFALAGVFRDEEIAMSIHAGWITSGFEGKVNVYRDISVMAGFTDYDAGRSGVDRMPQYSSTIQGTAGNRYHGMMIGRVDREYLRATYSIFRGNGKFNIYTRGVMFGQIAKLNGNIERWRIDTRFPRMPRNLGLSFEYYNGELKAAGHIEGWPFMDPLEDLLGLRRNFTADAKFKLWHLAARGWFDLPGQVALNVLLDLFRAYPDLEFIDWTPAFMVFGVADMDRYHDDYDRIDFGRLYLQASRSSGKITLGCDISQLFPIKVKKDICDAVESTPSPSPSSGGKKQRSDGGRNIHFWLGYNF